MPSLISQQDVEGFREPLELLQKHGALSAKLTLDQLKRALPPRQVQIVDTILNLDPSDFGIHIPRFGLESVPRELVAVPEQRYLVDGQHQSLIGRYVPKAVYEAFEQMARAFAHEHPGRQLLVESGYRSPAFQVIVFVQWLALYEYDLAKTIRHASPPAYSQHCLATNTAIDIMNIDGLPTDTDPEAFQSTIEYHWLKQHAHSYHFVESMPQNGQSGMRYEPWHWQYQHKESPT